MKEVKTGQFRPETKPVLTVFKTLKVAVLPVLPVLLDLLPILKGHATF